jgi:integrase
MPTVELTDRFCDRTKPGRRRIDYYDAKTTGLSLRIAPTGIKSFAVLYGPEAKRTRLTLGRYPRLSLARARTLAVEAMTRAHAGDDPRHNVAVTVSDVAAGYIERHVRPTLKSAKAVERRLKKNCLPFIGGVALADLHKRDLHRVMTPILARGSPVEAARVFEDVRAMVKWATAEGHLDFNPLEGMRKPAARPPRTRVLKPAEIAKLWNGLPKALPRSKAVANIIRLCLLTAARSGEVAGIKLDEINAKKRTWTVPAERSKNGEAHTIPLTDAAFEIAKVIAAAPKLSSHAVAHTIRLAQQRFELDQWTAHDLRRTAATNMAELGITPIVIAHVLNHVSVTRAGVTLGVYQQYDYAKEKREALTLWAERLAGIVASAAKVLSLGGRAL